MHWLTDFEPRVERDVPLAKLTWFGLGGAARWLASPSGPEELAALLRRARDAGEAVRVLGGGANVLVQDDGVDGVVVRLDAEEFGWLIVDGDRVIAGAGVDLMKLCNRCAAAGLAGVECLGGIPGTVGGAIRMNAGGRFGQIADVVERVHVVGADGAAATLSRDAFGFGYRTSSLGDRVVVAAELRLKEDSADAVRERLHDIWTYKKETQPLGERSAGCIFKNPPGDSAGRLIDAAGMKGASCGGATVSTRHANFVTADPGTRTADVLRLIERIRDAVMKASGVELEMEIVVW